MRDRAESQWNTKHRTFVLPSLNKQSIFFTPLGGATADDPPPSTLDLLPPLLLHPLLHHIHYSLPPSFRPPLPTAAPSLVDFVHFLFSSSSDHEEKRYIKDKWTKIGKIIYRVWEKPQQEFRSSCFSGFPSSCGHDRTELDACSTALLPVGLLIIRWTPLRRKFNFFT